MYGVGQEDKTVPNRTVPNGTAGQLMDEVCAYLSKPDPQIEGWPNVILNRSTESTASGKLSVVL